LGLELGSATGLVGAWADAGEAPPSIPELISPSVEGEIIPRGATVEGAIPRGDTIPAAATRSRSGSVFRKRTLWVIRSGAPAASRLFAQERKTVRASERVETGGRLEDVKNASVPEYVRNCWAEARAGRASFAYSAAASYG